MLGTRSEPERQHRRLNDPDDYSFKPRRGKKTHNLPLEDEVVEPWVNIPEYNYPDSDDMEVMPIN